MMSSGRFSQGLLIASFIFAVDQWTKMWVLSCAEAGDIPYAVAPFLNIILAGNRGVSFGLFHAESEFGVGALLGIAALLSCAVLYWLWHTRNRWSSIGLGFVLGGAGGNMLDRFRWGNVIDFIDFYIGCYHWYTFNLADCAIVVGMVIYLWGEHEKNA